MGVTMGKRNARVYILYLMENIGYPLDYLTLVDIVRLNDYVAYLDVAESFAELQDKELIEAVGKNEHNEDLYVVTQKGRMVSDALSGDILSPILDKSLNDALRYLDFQRRGITPHTSLERLPDGRVRVTLWLDEKGIAIYKNELVVDTLNRAQRMVDNFSERPDCVYRGIMAIVAGNVNYIFGENIETRQS